MEISTQLDSRFRHPFTCMVSGPSGSGKSMFVRNLLLNQDRFVNKKFDYVYMFLGTDAKENKTLSSLGASLKQRVKVFEMKREYPSRELMKEKFGFDLDVMLKRKSDDQQRGCIVFDDLMEELSLCGVLTKLFTKYSTHYDISVINITQNLFHQTAGKSEHTTVYRNTRIMVIFNNPMDNSVLTTVAKRLRPTGSSPLITMLNHIVKTYRYVVINAEIDRPSQLQFSTDIFATDPVPHQRIFQLRESGDNSDDD